MGGQFLMALTSSGFGRRPSRPTSSPTSLAWSCANGGELRDPKAQRKRRGAAQRQQQQAQQAQAQQGGEAGNKAADDVVDAEFEEVNDDNKK